MKEQSNSKGFAILSTAMMIVKLLSLIYSPFIFRILGGNRSFGIYNVTYMIYTFIYVITNSGIPSAISKLVSEFIVVGNYRSATKIFKISRLMLIIVGTIMAIVMFLVSAPITRIMHSPEARYSVIALCPAILFTSVGSTYRGYFQGRGNMKPTAISQVLEQIFNTVFSLLFAALLIGYGIEYGCVGATIGTTLGALVSSLFLIITYEKSKNSEGFNLKNTGKRIIHTNKQIFKRIVKYSIPITLCIGVPSLGSLIDIYNMISRLMVGGISENYAQSLYGIYSKFNVLTAVPITIISALAVTVLPAISKAVTLNNKKLTENKINFAYKISFIISIPAAVGLSVLSKPIYALLKYNDGYNIMLVGAGIVIFMALFQIQISILQGMGKIYIVTLYSILGIVIKYAINYILIAIPSINIYGAIIGSLVGFLVPVILNSIYIKVNLKLKIQLKAYIFKCIISSIAMGLAGYVIYIVLNFAIGFVTKGYINNAISVIVAIVVSIIIYVYTMILNKGITDDELNLLPHRIRRFIPFSNTP
ncbi:polysaccharide biosynthesis protein [Clostridium sp.]|jgi:stage V sporulation protein B|uniref:putative polysaccharide biosynthesis protein n=1 Tax=Clostridium sp. TaxID=1506 RepID=UPI00258D7A60|nr:polysaccharide biosynthesis protein [Clostridium sp.]MDF2505958.1 hypothetical protein [Clostridium sp.]